jgi:hypothetical protein
VLAVMGSIVNSSASSMNTLDLSIKVVAGSVGNERVRLVGLDVRSFGSLLEAEPGTAVAAVGLWRRGGEDDILRAGNALRIVTAQ